MRTTTLLSATMLALSLPGLAGAAASERTQSFGVLCTDYAGLVSGCRIGVSERAGA